MPSALWFVGGVFVGMMVSCVLFLFVMGAHEDDYDGFEETKQVWNKLQECLYASF
jgi:hypothetical protein